MGWTKRGNYHYFELSVRDGDRVRRVHLGRGEAAEWAALALEQRKNARIALLKRRETVESVLVTVRQTLAWCRTLHEVSLLLVGYYRHDRGAWSAEMVAGNDKNLPSRVMSLNRLSLEPIANEPEPTKRTGRTARYASSDLACCVGDSGKHVELKLVNSPSRAVHPLLVESYRRQHADSNADC